MVKVNELRVGNIVDDGSVVTGIRTLSDGCIVYFKDCYNNVLDIKPIPLTEEWIYKYGKKDEEGIFSYIPFNDLRIYLFDRTNGGIVICRGITTSLYRYEHIKYVHQLQNFYFALTGEELTLK